MLSAPFQLTNKESESTMSTATSFDFKTKKGFAGFKESKLKDGFTPPDAFAFGVATVKGLATILDVRFFWGVNFGKDAAPGVAAALDDKFGGKTDGTKMLLGKVSSSGLLDYFECFIEDEERHPNIEAIQALYAFKKLERESMIAGHHLVPVIVSIKDMQAPPVDAGDVYLRLHLLSLLKVKPNTINLKSAFGLLNNNCWTNVGVFDADSMDEVRLHFLRAGLQMPMVRHRDKFPHLVDYVTPKGVRIGDGARVRLGAHLAEGTTVMQEGFVNFNAGTLGKCMVEGRISAGVVVGAYSDIGGGASIMGTLSGGNDIVVSIGEGCLLEAESGLGIPIGDRVRVAAGHYVKGSSLVRLDLSHETWQGNSLMNDLAAEYRGGLFTGPQGTTWGTVIAEYLAGVSDVIFRRNDVDGTSEVIPRGDSTWGNLNEMLHNN